MYSGEKYNHNPYLKSWSVSIYNIIILFKNYLFIELSPNLMWKLLKMETTSIHVSIPRIQHGTDTQWTCIESFWIDSGSLTTSLYVCVRECTYVTQQNTPFAFPLLLYRLSNSISGFDLGRDYYVLWKYIKYILSIYRSIYISFNT